MRTVLRILLRRILLRRILLDPASQLNSVRIYLRLNERRASHLWRNLAIDYPRFRLLGLEIFHIYKRTDLRGLALLGVLASQSSVHTKKFVLASIFNFWITFHFTSSAVRLCVGYKMKTVYTVKYRIPGFVAK